MKLEPLEQALGMFVMRLGQPHNVQADGESVRFAAGPGTNLFDSPGETRKVCTCPALLACPPGTFQCKVLAAADLKAVFDAAMLLVWRDEEHWAKLCMELSPAGKPMVVSVVNNGKSDDANHAELQSSSVWLRVASYGTAYAFHFSLDGTFWQLVRYFSLPGGADIYVGPALQSPNGDGLTGVFEKIILQAEGLSVLRNGT